MDKKTPLNRCSRKQSKDLALRAHIKRTLIEKFGIVCARCGKWSFYLELSHKIPLARGGKTSFENCGLSCMECHGNDEPIS